MCPAVSEQKAAVGAAAVAEHQMMPTLSHAEGTQEWKSCACSMTKTLTKTLTNNFLLFVQEDWSFDAGVAKKYISKSNPSIISRHT